MAYGQVYILTHSSIFTQVQFNSNDFRSILAEAIKAHTVAEAFRPTFSYTKIVVLSLLLVLHSFCLHKYLYTCRPTRINLLTRMLVGAHAHTHIR